MIKPTRMSVVFLYFVLLMTQHLFVVAKDLNYDIEMMMKSDHYKTSGVMPFHALHTRRNDFCKYLQMDKTYESMRNSDVSTKPELAIGIGIRAYTGAVKSDLSLLATARDTWMKDINGFAEILIFVDCKEQLTGSAIAPPEDFKFIDQLPKLHWYCYQPIQPLKSETEEVTAIKNNFDKFAAMYSLMIKIMPNKTWYMKVDTDTVLIPKHIRSFLMTIKPYAGIKRGLIVGDIGEEMRQSNAGNKRSLTVVDIGKDNRKQSKKKKEKKKKKKKKTNPEDWVMYRARSGTRDGLFARPEWIELEKYFHPAAFKRWLQYTASGIQGGLILFSRSAMEKFVKHDCMMKVGSIPCNSKKKKNCINRPEDLVTGLCAHLTEVLLVDCHPCMRNIIGNPAAPAVWVKGALTTRKFCAAPMSTHPVKNSTDYLEIYNMLTFE